MRNSILAIAIALVLVAPCTALAGDKNKSKGIEVQDYGFGASRPVTTSRSDGGGATVGRKNGAPGVIHATPDGYTLLWVHQTNTITVTLYDTLIFNFIRDIHPVAGILRVPAVMEVTPSFPAKTVPEFIAYAKANPGKINYASPGLGSSVHVFGELFKMMAGVDLVMVHYRGSFFPDLLGGQVQVTISLIPSSIDFIRAGKLRALAVTTAARQEVLPDIPTVGEFVNGYEATAWFGIGAPKNTPAGVVEKLNREINAGLADPKIKKRLTDLGALPMPMTPTEFGQLLTDETERWAKVVRSANIKTE